MRCSQFLSSFSAYRDGLIDPVTREDIERHLAGCDRCRRHDAAFALGVRLLRSEELDVSHESRVRLRVRLALAGRTFRSRRAAPIGAAAVIAGLALAWGAVGTPRTNPPTRSIMSAAPIAPPLSPAVPVAPRSGKPVVAVSTTHIQSLATTPPAPLVYTNSFQPAVFRTVSLDPEF